MEEETGSKKLKREGKKIIKILGQPSTLVRLNSSADLSAETPHVYR